MTVSVSIKASVATIVIDNPPVNAISHAVRVGLMTALDEVERTSEVRQVVLRCAGRTFVAGADVREFDAPPKAPHLPDVCSAIEGASKPWVAVLHGTVLGGGLELAMACHARVADPATRLGLPEVTLGLIPGAGGSVRLPRLVPPTLALTMIAGGKPIDAAKALEAGLIDAVTSEPVGHALDIAPSQSTLSRPLAGFDADAFRKVKAKLVAKARGQISVGAAVAAVERAMSLPADEALAAERAAFLDLKGSAQAKALRYIFFAERQSLRDPRCKGPAHDLQTIGVIGGGTMGAGISAACLLAGFCVQMIERDGQAAESGHVRVKDILGQSVSRGILSQGGYDQAFARFKSGDDYAALGGADLVIEAVFEDLALKREVFANLDMVTKPDAILATNTSYLDVNAIAVSVSNPSRVVGLHFFSPAHVMKLLEIILPDNVADHVVATTARFAKRLGKIGVFAGVCDGFIGNRIMSAYRHEADCLLLEGATPWDIDAAMRDFGFGMGIYQMQDLAGLDIAWAMRKRRSAENPPEDGYIAIADRICERGWFGQKTGRGWYVYQDGRAMPYEGTMAIIEDERAVKDIGSMPMTADTIMARIMGRLQSEAQAVLNEGIAACPEDIDVVMVNGYGFPRWRGGPMFALSKATEGAIPSENAK